MHNLIVRKARPTDIEQREGRIIRQGNDNSEVEIYNYVTKGTFDSYLWQLVETKQKFISQIMTSKTPVRCAEDIDKKALSFAEIKAIASDNPLIKEKMDLDLEVSNLSVLKSNYLKQKYRLEDSILNNYPQEIQKLDNIIKSTNQDISLLNSLQIDKENFCGIILNGKTYLDKKEAGEELINICKNMLTIEQTHIGKYRNFNLELFYDKFSQEFCTVLKNKLSYSCGLGTDPIGNITRLDNTLKSIPDRLAQATNELEETKIQLTNAKEQLAKPFAKETELQDKTARLNELNSLLNLDKKDELFQGTSEENNEEENIDIDESQENDLEM